MRTRRGRRLGIGLLAGIVGLLALLDLHLLQSAVDISPMQPPASGDDSRLREVVEPATPLDTKSPEQFGEIVGRPLFHPSRRSVQRKESGPAAEPRLAASRLRLIGVMRMGEGPPRALMRFANEPMGKWIVEGAEFRGWRLRQVKERSVIVEAGQRQQELTLPKPSPARAEPTAEAAGAGGDADSD